MEGCNPALPRRSRRGRDVLTGDGAGAVDTERVSAASDAEVSWETHRISACVPTVVHNLATAPQAASEVVQPRPQDSAARTYSHWLMNVGSRLDLILRMLGSPEWKWPVEVLHRD